MSISKKSSDRNRSSLSGPTSVYEIWEGYQGGFRWIQLSRWKFL